MGISIMGAGMHKKLRQRGFSLLETMIVVAIMMIVGAFAVMSFVSALQNQRAESALQLLKREMQNARGLAIGSRSVYYVTFTAPRTITTTNYVTTAATTNALPPGFSFDTETTSPTPPDGYGTGSTAVDFGYGVTHNLTTSVYFYPDGSARDNLGRLNGGVVYIAMPGKLTSAHAVSVIGATGRVAGWRLANISGTLIWKED